jgi:Domain of unknown function (DUF4276)
MLAFVEGKMERQFINSNMKYVHVVPVQNGISWTLERMCLQIVTAFEALDMKCEVAVWIDREGRTEEAHQIAECIRGALVTCGALSESVHILINDRMAENVILADEEMIKIEFGDHGYSYEMEGRPGKTYLRNKYRENGINYKETDHGVRLLKKMRLSRARQKSPSVAHFLTTFNQECWWV